MKPKQAIRFVRKNDFTDEPDSPVRDQLADEARSMARWAGLYIILFAVPILAADDLGTSWSIVICGIFLGKGLMYAYEAMRLRTAVSCFDRHDARTLEDLVSRCADSG